MSRLIEIKENKEIWIIENSPTADKRIYDRITGNWIASFKDGNEVARAIPHNGGLKFPCSTRLFFADASAALLLI